MRNVKGIFRTAVSGILTAAMLLTAFLYSVPAFDDAAVFAMVMILNPLCERTGI